MAAIVQTPHGVSVALLEGDLIPDRALTEVEQDQFRHSEIAARLADLLTIADPPLNVALFGPWGSGKSSFATLLRKALAQPRKMKTAFVVYDAWKYSGEALQRSFIAEAAIQLKVDNPFYTSQLAQTVERTQLDLKQVSWAQSRAYLRWVGVLIAPLAAIGVGVVAAGISLVSWIADRSISRELVDYLPLLVVPISITIIGAVLKIISDNAKGKLVEGPPTDERFEERFKSLLKEAAAQGNHERVVFFVDELDRVAPEEVVKTLAVIKNFLDQKNAVFVVAADKQVLEGAFQKLPQATPTNEDDPYYSSASEFLDKIFQHQLALPPLRGPSLLRFAHNLVAGRAGGLWEELKNAEPNAARLDAVLYALIPSHVRSPRRVKVLLNNFATNARIAQSRGIDWTDRAREIAKLTALQTEFPLFAADLDIEQRLPSLVIDSSGYVLAERTQRLLVRHGVGSSGDQTTNGDEREDGEADGAPSSIADGSTGNALAGATDRLLVPRREQARLVSVQRDNLRRYLIRTEGVPDPSRALLFLEPGGAAEGLADPALGELLEAEARDNPAAIVTAAGERGHDEQQAIVRVLAGMSEDAYAEERSNVIQALLDVVLLLDGELGASLPPAANAVASFSRSQRLGERQLVGALRVGVAAARANGDASLRDHVLSDERLLRDATRVRLLACLLDDLPKSTVEQVSVAVGDGFSESSDVLLDALRLVSPSAAETLLMNARVGAAIKDVVAGLAADDAEMLAADLFDALADRVEDAPRARLRLMRLLCDSDSPAVYPAISQRAEMALAAARTGRLANGVALAALRISPAEDWELWRPWLDENVELFAPHKKMADIALVKVFGLLADADEGQLEVALELGPTIANVARLADDDLSTALSSTVELALRSRPWWSGGSPFDEQETIHAIVRAFAGVILGPSASTWSNFADLRYSDLVRGATTDGLTASVFRAVRRWATALKSEHFRDLATRLAAVPLSGADATDVELIAARTHLWKEAAEVDEDVDETPYAVSVEDIVAVAASGDDRAQDIVISWLGASVVDEMVVEIITGIDRGPSPREAKALTAWFVGLDDADARTNVLNSLATDGGHALDWLREAVAASPRDFSEHVVAHAVVSDAMKAARAEERRAAVDALGALSPTTPDTQREVGRFIVWLLSLDHRVDFESAVAAVPALGATHSMGRQLGAAFRRGLEREQRRIPHGHRGAFEQAKIVLGQGYFEDPKKKARFTGLRWKK
jgi:hypothetical protein